MAGTKKEFLVISYLNLRGQTGLPVEKQFQVENFLKENNCDILHLQEAQIDKNTFGECNFIGDNFAVISNNAKNKYGPLVLSKMTLL